MKRLACVTTAALMLAACSPAASDTDARYSLKMSGVEGDRVQLVADAAERVVQRVVQSMGQEIRSKKLEKKGQNYVLHVELKDQKSAPVLTDVLSAGFRFRLMQEWPKATADVTAKLQQGEVGFKETGITEKDLSWVDVASVKTTDSQGKSTEVGQVTIQLTPAGKELFKQVQKQNADKMLALYVRNRLVSTMRVAPNQASDFIVISNVPSLEVASVFADDVNVGLHVTFVPQGAALRPTTGSGATATGSTAATSVKGAAGSR